MGEKTDPWLGYCVRVVNAPFPPVTPLKGGNAVYDLGRQRPVWEGKSLVADLLKGEAYK